MNLAERRVVVTGIGMLTPLGSDIKTTWSNILAGKSGVRLVDTFDTSRLRVKISASVKDFKVEDYFSTKEARKFDPFVHYATAASIKAMEDSGLVMDEKLAERSGIALGSGIGGLEGIAQNHLAALKGGPRRISPFFIPGAIINMAAGHISIKLNLQGPNIAIVTACTTGVHNIGHAARIIARGDADVMLGGGAEMATTELGIGGFASMRALSTRNDEPERASRPWDKDRDGFVLGDGAGVMILEEYEHAKKRGAKIYAELIGFGMSADAHHMTSPSEKGMYMSMVNAIKDAHLPPEKVDYINAHGTSTPIGDPVEIAAIKHAFKDHAYQLAVSSTKSMIGHLLGAAGAVEAIFCVLALRDQIMPPTINLDNPDEGCDLNLVPHKAQEKKLDYVVNNSFGFGGTNGSLVFARI